MHSPTSHRQPPTAPLRVFWLATLALSVALAACNTFDDLSDLEVNGDLDAAIGDDMDDPDAPGSPDAGDEPPQCAQSEAECAEAIWSGPAGSHTCARTEDDAVRCWGNNFQGQLGDGQRLIETPFPAPFRLDNLASQVITDVTAGYDNTCVVTGGRAHCVGRSQEGQMGFLGAASSTPVTITTMDQVVQVSSGRGHACALIGDDDNNGVADEGEAREIWCWGFEDYGVLGPVPTAPPTIRHVPLPDENPAKLIAGADHHCVITEDQDLYCWGADHAQQLGRDGEDNMDNATCVNTPCRRTPGRQTTPLTSVADAGAGALHTCALLDNREVWCWGSNDQAQLGHGEVGVGGPLNPAPVEGLGEATRLAVGERHNCALANQREIWCWGANDLGQAGINTAGDPISRPQRTLSSDVVVDLQAGGNHTCAILGEDDGTSVWCWGANDHGQAGSVDGETPLSETPLRRLAPARIDGLDGASRLVLGYEHSCALFDSGEMRCWGFNLSGHLGRADALFSSRPLLVDELSGAAVVSAGDSHGCALIEDKVGCWGDNSDGQLGLNDRPNALSPTLLTTLGEATRVGAGTRHSCALTTESGEVWCWGLNTSGAAGADPEVTNVPQPARVVSEAQALSVGAFHNCVIDQTREVQCWGLNDEGQLGRTTPQRCQDGALCDATPDKVQDLTEVSAVSLGGRHSCAINDADEVWCWGSNSDGQRAQPFEGELDFAPTRVDGIDGRVTQLALGDKFSCALTEQGQVWCWGSNNNGEVGTDNAISCAPGRCVTTPSEVLLTANSAPAIGVTAGSQHACALLADGSVWCWGNHETGQLGNPEALDEALSTPTRVDLSAR